jgi:hypothetical protein
MRESFLSICLFFFLTGCSSLGEVIVKKDSFKNALTVTMKHEYSSVETKGFLQGSTKVLCTYYREIKGKQKAPAEIAFRIDVDEREEGLKSEAYIKVGTENFKIKLSDVKTEARSLTTYDTKTTTKNKNALAIGTDVNQEDDLETVTETEASTLCWKELKGTLILPLHIEQKILKSDSMAFRLYMGKKPLTFDVKDRKLVQVKGFFATTGKKE